MNQQKEYRDVKDEWLKDIRENELYTQYLYGYFDKPDQERVAPLKLTRLELERTKYWYEGKKVGGDEFYLLKKGKIGGKLLERQIFIKDDRITQIKTDSKNNAIEKDLGLINRLEIADSSQTFSGVHSTKTILNAYVTKEGGKQRKMFILCNNKQTCEKVQSTHTILRDTTSKKEFATRLNKALLKFKDRFKQQGIQYFIEKLKLAADDELAKRDQRLNEKENLNKAIGNIFSDYDSKYIKDFISKWKALAARQEKANLDDKEKSILDQQKRERDRKLQKLRQSAELNSIDKRAVKSCLTAAVEAAKIREQQDLEDQEEQRRADKVKRSRNEKKLSVEFSQIILSQNLKYVRPIVDIYYIVNKKISSYDTYKVREEGKTADVIERGQAATPDQLRRKINKKEWQLKSGRDELFQMVFTGRMHSKMSDNSYIWNLREHTGFQTTSEQLNDSVISFSDLESCEKDTLKISVYDEMNKQNKTFTTYVTVSDILTAQMNTKQIWLNLTLDGLKNQPTKVLLKANIFKQPTIQSQVHNSFDHYMERFADTTYQMIDPIYQIPLQNLTLIRSSMIYFLEKTIEEGLGSANSIKLLQFLIDVVPNEEGVQTEFPQDISDRLVYRDFRKVYYESISMHLTSSYAKNLLLQEDQQQELLEKIGRLDNEIHTVIQEIQNFKTIINYHDLKKLFIYGVPSRNRCLYWSNFLQINNAVSDDITRGGEEYLGPEDLVKRFEFYEKLDNRTQTQSFFDDLEIDLMGQTQVEQLSKILIAFTNYLKFHRIVDLRNEDHLRFNLYKFIQRVFVSLYPTFMKTEDNLHASFFDANQKAGNHKNLVVSMQKLDQNDFTEDELTIKNEKIRAEIFWFSVAFYNLYFKHLVAMEDQKGMESLKKRLATGIVAYETLLNPHSQLMIKQNQLQDNIKKMWFSQNTNFFEFTFQSYHFTRILDIVVFEFGMNLMDGFETAIMACFVTLLDKVKLDGIINFHQLKNAFITEGLFLQQSFFTDLYKNIDLISKGFDKQLIERKIQTIQFSQFGELYLPIEENEQKMEIDRKDLMETLHTSMNNKTLELVQANANPSGENQQNNLSSPQKSRVVNVKSPYQVNRKDFLEQDDDDGNQLRDPVKSYLVSHRVRVEDFEKLEQKKQ